MKEVYIGILILFVVSFIYGVVKMRKAGERFFWTVFYDIARGGKDDE